MPKVSVYNQEGKETGTLELSSRCFGVEVKSELVHEVIVAHQANARTAHANTKTKGEVRGGGKKPWKQKGTGRARHGSSRSPLWIGGGITHGPRAEKNFSLKVNRKVKRKALCMILSDKVVNRRMIVLEKPNFKDTKTKEAATLFANLPLYRETLFVIPESNPMLLRMVKNIPTVKLVTVNTLNVFDAMRYPTILFEKDAVARFEKTYGTV
ncbi:MAG: 50S ribosomal protein L4 [bacterium]|nr:50S ribosomal protein L4 [bacterium]